MLWFPLRAALLPLASVSSAQTASTGHIVSPALRRCRPPDDASPARARSRLRSSRQPAPSSIRCPSSPFPLSCPWTRRSHRQLLDRLTPTSSFAAGARTSALLRLAPPACLLPRPPLAATHACATLRSAYPGACLAALPLGLLGARRQAKAPLCSLTRRPPFSPRARATTCRWPSFFPTAWLRDGRPDARRRHNVRHSSSLVAHTALSLGLRWCPAERRRTRVGQAPPSRSASLSTLPLSLAALASPAHARCLSSPAAAVGRRTREVSERQQEPRALLVDRFPAIECSQ